MCPKIRGQNGPVSGVKTKDQSDQYDLKLQIAGLNSGYERVVVRDEGMNGSSIWYYSGDRLFAVDALNNARAFMAGRRIIEYGRTVPPELVQDTGLDMKTLVAHAV